MIEPGRLRSARQNHGPDGQRDGRAPPGVVEQVGRGAGGDAGEHAAAGVELRARSSTRSTSAAAGTSPASRGCCSKPPLPRITPRRARTARSAPSLDDADADDPAVLDHQVGQLGARSATGTPASIRPLRRPMARALPIAYIFRPSTMLTQPVEHDLEHGERAAQGAQAEADLAEVGLGDDQVGRRLGVRRVQPVELVAEEPRVHRHRLDAAPEGTAAGLLGVVVGVLGHPGEAQRGVSP